MRYAHQSERSRRDRRLGSQKAKQDVFGAYLSVLERARLALRGSEGGAAVGAEAVDQVRRSYAGRRRSWASFATGRERVLAAATPMVVRVGLMTL